MEATQVQQLKLNVTNINSFLKKSNKTYIDLKKSNRAIVSQEVKQRKLKAKESKVVKRISSKPSPLTAVKKIASPAMSLFDKIVNFGSILATGVLINAIPGFKKKIDEFREENKEVIDNVVKTLTVVKDGMVSIFDSITGPASEKGAYDWLAKFDSNNQLESGILKEVEKTFNEIGKFANFIDKALGGSGTLGNQFITDRSGNKIDTSRLNLISQTERGSGMSSFREDSAQNAALQEKVKARRSSDSTGTISSLGSGNLKLNNLTDQDYSDLAFAVSGEAQRGTDDEYGVAANILTRVADPNYPNTIMGVFTAPGQYAAYSDGGARRDPQLASKLKANKDKIADAIQILNGRTDFKGVAMYGNMGPGDIKFSNRGNFYHYASQRGRNDPAPKNPPQYWKKLINSKPNPAKITPKPRDKNNQASVLNTTIGEEGTTTFVLMRQQVIT